MHPVGRHKRIVHGFRNFMADRRYIFKIVTKEDERGNPGGEVKHISLFMKSIADCCRSFVKSMEPDEKEVLVRICKEISVGEKKSRNVFWADIAGVFSCSHRDFVSEDEEGSSLLMNVSKSTRT